MHVWPIDEHRSSDLYVWKQVEMLPLPLVQLLQKSSTVIVKFQKEHIGPMPKWPRTIGFVAANHAGVATELIRVQ